MTKKALWLFASILFFLSGCARKTISTPLKTLPSGKELQRYLETHKEDERSLLLQEIKALLDETSYEEICDTLELEILEWQNTQADYPIDHISLAFSSDPSLLTSSGNQNTETCYNTVSVQAQVSMHLRQIKETHRTVNERIFNQLESRIMDTVYGQYKVHTLSVTIRDTDNPTEKIPGSFTRTYYINNDIFAPDAPADDNPLKAYTAQWIEELNRELYPDEPEGMLYLKHFEAGGPSRPLRIELLAGTAPPSISLSLIPDILEEKSGQLFQDLSGHPDFPEASVESIVLIYHTPWKYIPYDRYSFSYKVPRP